MDFSSINNDDAITLTTALEHVLNSRTHKRTHLGEEITVPGSLSVALGLPNILKSLKKNSRPAQQRAISQLEDIWPTLSETTRELVITQAGLVDPKSLAWDDPRSNRHKK